MIDRPGDEHKGVYGIFVPMNMVVFPLSLAACFEAAGVILERVSFG